MGAPANPIGVGVVGLGVGEQHARGFAADGRTRVTWLHDFDPGKAAALARDIGQGAAADSYGRMLEDPETSVVSIASYDHLHYEQVRAALAAGKRVFVEKPLCRTMAELADLVAAWQAAGRPCLASNLVLREAQVYRWLGDAVRAGRLGRVYAIDGDYLYGRLAKITEGWRRDVPDYSVMEGGGVHLVDLMMGLAGERPVRVASHGNRLATAGTAFRYDDFMAATFTFPSGLIGRITANFACVHRHHHVLRVFGTEATFILDDRGPRLHASRDEDREAEALDLATLPAGKAVLIPAFIDALASGADTRAMAGREFDLISAIAASDRALAEGRELDIEYLT